MYEELSLSIRRKYGYDIIDMKGEVTFEETKTLEDFVKDEISEDTEHVVLNLDGVPFINSSALSVVVKLMQELKEKGIDLSIMNPNETIRGLFEMTGVKKYFKFIRNEEVLIEKLKQNELDSALNKPEE